MVTFMDFFTPKSEIDDMKRYLEKYLIEDLKKKIVLLTGPRQTGKTTLSKMLKTDFDYLNFDNSEDRMSLFEESWDHSKWPYYI